MSTADASMDLLNAKLKVDNQQFVNPVKAAGDALIRFKTILDSLNQQGNQSSGIGAVVRGIATIGELAKKYFAVDVPQAIGKTKLSLNELASGVGAVRKQVKGLGDDLTSTSRGARQAFDAMAQAAQKAAKASKDSGNAARDSMRTAAQEAKTTGRELVLVGQQGARMGEMVYAGARRAAEGVAGLAMTVQRAGQMIASSGMGGLLAGPGGGGAMAQRFGVQMNGYTLNQPGGQQLLLGGPTGPARPNISNMGAFAQYTGMMMQGRGIGGMQGLAGILQRIPGMMGGMGGGALGAVGNGMASGFQTALRSAQSFGNAAKSALDVATSGMRTFNTAASAAVATVGLLTVGGLKFGAGYEQSMARVKAVTQATDAEFAQLDATAQKLGVETVYSAKDAADGMAQLAMGGYKVNQIIGAMPSVMSLAAVSQVEVGQASRTLVNVMEAMRLHVDELPHSIDVLARAMTLGGNDMEEFAYAFKYIGPTAKAAGMSLEEVAATIQLLGKQGINASMAGTSLRGIISQLAQDGKKLKKTFDELGVAVYDDAGKLKSLPDIIDALNAGLSKTGRESESLKIVMDSVSQRAGASFQALLTLQGDAIRDAMAKLKDSAGYADQIAEIQQSTLGNRLKQLIESVTTFGITLTKHVSGGFQESLLKMNDWLAANKPMIDGTITAAWDKFAGIVKGISQSAVNLYERFLPTLQMLGEKFYAVYSVAKEWYDSLTPAQQDLVKVGIAMTVLGTVLEKVGGMIPIVGGLATAVGKLLNPTSLVGGAFKLLVPLIGTGGSVFLGFMGLVASGGPIALLIAAIIGTGGLVAILNGDLMGSLTGIGDTLKGAFVDAFSAAKEGVAAFTAYMRGDALEAIGHVHKAVGDLASAVGLNGLAGELRQLGDSEIMRSKGDKAIDALNQQNYGSRGAAILEERASAQEAATKERNKLHDLKRKYAPNSFSEFAHGAAMQTESVLLDGRRMTIEQSRKIMDGAIADQQRKVDMANARERDAVRRAQEFEKDKNAQYQSRVDDAKARDNAIEEQNKMNERAAMREDAAAAKQKAAQTPQDISTIPAGASSLNDEKLSQLAAKRIAVALGDEKVSDAVRTALIKMESAAIRAGTNGAPTPAGMISLNGGAGAAMSRTNAIEGVLENYRTGDPNHPIDKARQQIVDTLDRNLAAQDVKARQQRQGQRGAMLPAGPTQAPVSGGVPSAPTGGAAPSAGMGPTQGIGAESGMQQSLAQTYAQQLTAHFASTGDGGKGVVEMFKTGQGDIASALKPDREGNIDADKAKEVAGNYKAVMQEMDGVNKAAVDKWYGEMMAAIDKIKNAPGGLRHLFADSLENSPVKASGVLTPGGRYGGAVTEDLMKADEHKKQKQEEQHKAAAFGLDQTTKAQVDNLGMRMKSNGFPGQGNLVFNEKQQRADANQLIRDQQQGMRGTVQDVRQNMPKAKGAAGVQQQGQAMGMLSGMVSQFNEMMQGAKQASGQTQKDMLQNGLKLKTAIEAVAAAMKNGTFDMKKLDEIVKATGADMKNLDQAEKDRAAKANGQMTDAQKAAMQQQQQFGQQMQQAWTNAANQAAQQQGQAMFEGGQAMLQQALGGPGEVQAMIDQAAATGDKKTAFALIRQRLESQLKVSMSNLHNLASDPMAGGGFGPEHGGQSNDAYFMTLDIPLVRMIKFLKAQLDHLPKMAAGGIVTGATPFVAGEAGPEAVMPLNKFANMLGALPVFSGIQNAMERIGDYFNGVGYGYGNNPAMANRYFASLSQIQHTFEYSVDSLRNMRRINFSPGSYQQPYYQGMGYPFMPGHGAMAFGAGSAGLASTGLNMLGNLTLNFHGIDITNPNAASTFARQLLPALDREAQRLGGSAIGGSALRMASTGGRAFGYNR